MGDKALTLADGLVRIRQFSKDFYQEYPGTTENQLNLALTFITEGNACFLADVLDPVQEDAMLIMEATAKVTALLNDFKQEIMKKKRSKTNWSN